MVAISQIVQEIKVELCELAHTHTLLFIDLNLCFVVVFSQLAVLFLGPNESIDWSTIASKRVIDGGSGMG